MKPPPIVTHAWGVFGRGVNPVSTHEQRGSAERSADLLRERELRATFRVLSITRFKSPYEARAESE